MFRRKEVARHASGILAGPHRLRTRPAISRPLVARLERRRRRTFLPSGSRERREGPCAKSVSAAVGESTFATDTHREQKTRTADSTPRPPPKRIPVAARVFSALSHEGTSSRTNANGSAKW